MIKTLELWMKLKHHTGISILISYLKRLKLKAQYVMPFTVSKLYLLVKQIFYHNIQLFLSAYVACVHICNIYSLGAPCSIPNVWCFCCYLSRAVDYLNRFFALVCAFAPLPFGLQTRQIFF